MVFAIFHLSPGPKQPPVVVNDGGAVGGPQEAARGAAEASEAHGAAAAAGALAPAAAFPHGLRRGHRIIRKAYQGSAKWMGVGVGVGVGVGAVYKWEKSFAYWCVSRREWMGMGAWDYYQ